MMLKLVFLILLYLKCYNTIHLALSVEPKNLGIVKVVKKAIAEHRIPSIEVDHLQVLIANDNLTKNEIYQQLTHNDSNPILLIDTTLKNGANSSFASKIKQLVRDIGLPTIATGPSLGRPFKNIEQWQLLGLEERKNLIEFSSTEEQIAVIITDLTRHFSADPAILLYDNQFDLTEKYSYLFKNTRGKYLAKRIDLENYSDVIEQVKKFERGYFFVLASIEMANKMLQVVHADGLLTIQRNWYFITKNIGKLECEVCNYGSITLIQPLRTKQALYDHNCSMSKFTTKLSKLDAYFYYDLVRFVLHTLVEIKQSMIKDGLSDALDISFLTQSLLDPELIKRKTYFNLRYQMSMESFVGHYGRFVVHPLRNEKNYPHYQELTMRLSKIEFWKPKEPQKLTTEKASTTPADKLGETGGGDDETQSISNLNLIKYGEWIYEPPSGLFVWTAALQANKKVHYKIVTIVQPPFIMKRINGTQVEWYGYCLDLLEGMQKEMNDSWTFEMYEVPDGQYGIKDMTTNKWNGIIGQLSDKFADIAVGPVSVMAERESVVDFTVPYYDLVGVSILMKKSASRSHLFKFLTVLENEVWLHIFNAYVVTSIILWLFDKLSPYSFSNNREKHKSALEKRDFNLKECFWFCMTSITPQGGGEAPKNISGRMVVAIWWIFGFIVIACYTANLAAFLTVSRLDSPIESLNHLADQYRIRYAAQVGTQALTYFERMSYIEHKFYEIWKEITLKETNIVDSRERARMSVWDYPISDKYTKILKQMHISGLPKTFDEGVKRVKKSKSAQEGFAFLADATKIKYAAMINCELRQVGNEFSRKPLALAVPENSTLKDVLSSAILKLLNQRKLESLKEKWWNDNPDKKEDCDYDKKSNDGISINNIGGVFVVIFIGVVLACVTLFFEWIWKKIKGNNAQATVVNIQQFRPNDFGLPVNYNNNLVGSMNLNNYNAPMSTIYEKKPMAKDPNLAKYN